MLESTSDNSNRAPSSTAVMGMSSVQSTRPVVSVPDWLLAGKAASRPALESDQSAWTYGELDFGSRALAAFLLESGARKGDRVLLIADNSFFWVVSYLGILRSGLICVPLPSNVSRADLTTIIQFTAAAVACVDRETLIRNTRELPRTCITNQLPDSFASPAQEIKTLEQIMSAGLRRTELPPIYDSDLAALMFTSGSTGKPRGVMVTHGNIVANTRSIIEYLKLTADDSMLTVLPFHYCFGTSLLHTHLAVGGKLVLENGFMYTEAFLNRLQHSQCTGFAGVPSHYQILLRRSSIRHKTFPYLRYVQQAGGHMAPAFIRELCQALPTTQIFVMYGQTEATARLAYVPPEMLDRKLGSIGQAIPGVRLSVVNPNGEPVAFDEVGEIVAEGQNITLGYWGEPAETAASFRAGKLHTGDLATVDEDGFIYIVDRAKDFVKIGGKRTSCRQLEEQMLEFSDLLEVAVIGIPDSVSGEAIKAFVVPRDTRDKLFLQRFKEFCAKHLPPHQIPKEIVQRSALPKSTAGKVLKSALKDAEPMHC